MLRLVKFAVIAYLATAVSAGASSLDEIQGPVAVMEVCSYTANDSSGQVVKTLTGRSKVFYDANLNPVEAFSYDASGVILEHRVCKYDKDGRLLEVVVFDGNGSFLEKIIVTHHENTIIYKDYDAKHNLLRETCEEYDETGRLIEATVTYFNYSYFLNGKVRWPFETWLFHYGPDGKLREVVYYDFLHQIPFIEVQEFFYNVESMDLIIKTTRSCWWISDKPLHLYFRGEKIISSDRYGNWTEKHVFEKKERSPGVTDWVLVEVYKRIFWYR
jgi:antitoxin component YwqK of YwqJK toxin-antitoxin module